VKEVLGRTNPLISYNKRKLLRIHMQTHRHTQGGLLRLILFLKKLGMGHRKTNG
jgi:hypothetical protein